MRGEFLKRVASWVRDKEASLSLPHVGGGGVCGATAREPLVPRKRLVQHGQKVNGRARAALPFGFGKL